MITMLCFCECSVCIFFENAYLKLTEHIKKNYTWGVMQKICNPVLNKPLRTLRKCRSLRVLKIILSRPLMNCLLVLYFFSEEEEKRLNIHIIRTYQVLLL